MISDSLMKQNLSIPLSLKLMHCWSQVFRKSTTLGAIHPRRPRGSQSTFVAPLLPTRLTAPGGLRGWVPFRVQNLTSLYRPETARKRLAKVCHNLTFNPFSAIQLCKLWLYRHISLIGASNSVRNSEIPVEN